MQYLETTALKLLALLGLGSVGTTGWILIVVGIAVIAGLAGRLWDRRARKTASGGTRHGDD